MRYVEKSDERVTLRGPNRPTVYYTVIALPQLNRLQYVERVSSIINTVLLGLLPNEKKNPPDSISGSMEKRPCGPNIGERVLLLQHPPGPHPATQSKPVLSFDFQVK